MQEEFLHYLWKYKKYDFTKAKTTQDELVVLINAGQHNLNSGPDFFNAKIEIGDQLWAGNVEIHLKSSDWYAHAHQTDPAYDNVILHVVWKDDVEIYRKDNTVVPTLVLKDLVPDQTLENYKGLLLAPNSKWINCEKDFPGFDNFDVENWLERLYLERLQEKSQVILKLLEKSGNNWEEVLFKMLAKNFGLNVNGDAFLSMAQSFSYKTVQKLQGSQLQLESLFFGQSGLLEQKIEEPYFQKLKGEYIFLKRKFKLENRYVERAKYFRLRPDNFPNIRLSQLATLYNNVPRLFSEIIKINNKEQLYRIFEVETSSHWKSHYSFNKPHKERKKELTKNFVDLLIINTIVPLKFCYMKMLGEGEVSLALGLIEEVKTEKNTVVNKFNRLRPKTSVNALQSQGLLHMKKQYCDKNACLNCRLGTKLVQKFM